MKLLAVNICVVLVAAFLAHEASALRCYECQGKECDKVTDDTHVVDKCHPDSTEGEDKDDKKDDKKDEKKDDKKDEKNDDKKDDKKDEKTDDKKDDKNDDKKDDKTDEKKDDKKDEKKDEKKDDKNDDKKDSKRNDADNQQENKATGKKASLLQSFRAATNADEPHCYVREYKDGDKTMFERGWAADGKFCEQYKDKKSEVKCVQCFDDKCNTAGSLTASILVMLVALAIKTL